MTDTKLNLHEYGPVFSTIYLYHLYEFIQHWPPELPPPFRKTLLDVNFLTGSVKSFILVSIKKMTSNSLQAMAVAKYLLLKKPLDPMLRQGPS